MRRILLGAVGSVLSVGLLFAQADRVAATNAPERPSRDAQAQALLVRSYLLSRAFTPEERCFYLTTASPVAARVDVGLARLWSEELFQISHQLTLSWNRVAFQKNALRTLATIDPERAMELFGAMDDPVPMKGGYLPEDLRSDAALVVFQQLWKQKARSSLGEIRLRAQQIGSTGEYPYLAILPIVQSLQGQKDPEAAALVGEALSFYKRGSPVSSADEDFITFLDAVHSEMPRSMLREALEEIVSNATKHGPEGTQVYRTRVHTDKGIAEFDNPGDHLLFLVLPLLRDVDKDWADRLVEQRQELAKASAFAGTVQFDEGVLVAGPATGKDAESLEQIGMQESRLSNVTQLAAEDPKEALRLSFGLTDPALRSIALMRVASGFATTDPDQGRAILKQTASAAGGIDDPLAKLRLLAATAEASAALGQADLLHDSLKGGFALGQEVVQEDLDRHPGKSVRMATGFRELQELTQVGARSDLDSAVGYLDATQSPVLQAYLLISLVQESLSPLGRNPRR